MARAVLIRSEEAGLSWSGTLRLLQSVLPITFRFATRGGADAVAEIVPALNGTTAVCSGATRFPSLAIPAAVPACSNGKLWEMSVCFADDPEVPFPFRGRVLRTRIATEPRALELGTDERALATSEGRPLWSVCSRDGVKHFRSALELPAIAANQTLHDALNGDHFLELLPVLQWCREVCKDQLPHSPPLRACFVFDDPNLHWVRYGYVDFRRIAEQAARLNYHVAFATIPLDAWFTHGPTAQLFRSNAERLSLCVHGNDHTRQELARNYSESQRVFLLQQALQRLTRLERSAGVRVCRVMVPPHGACSEDMLRDLPGCGFESACISHGSLRAHNRSKDWTRTLGYRPSEWVQACPVLPRWGLTGDVRNTVLLAAFLGQAIILRAHHQDLRNGIELLDHTAAFINSLGPVRWTSLTGVGLLNCQWRLDGGVCGVKPLSRAIMLETPGPADRLLVEADLEGGEHRWRISFPNGGVSTVCAGEMVALPEGQNGSIRVALHAPPPRAAVGEPARSSAPAFLRRLLTEARDRLLV
jgi:hypothetical protein